jgi:serine/threonine-protein kinase HipA
VKFTGNITYYIELRKSQEYGSMNDEIVDFTADFPNVTVDLLNMFVADYIMNQEDRHAKNFGIMADGSFSPIYDNGYSLYYDWLEENLGFSQNGAARVKFLSKDPVIVIEQYCEWLNAKPCVDFDIVLKNLDNIDEKYKGLMTQRRLDFNRTIVERRVKKCRELLT